MKQHHVRQLCDCGNPVGSHRTASREMICDRCWKIEQDMKYKSSGPTYGQSEGVKCRSFIEPYKIHINTFRFS